MYKNVSVMILTLAVSGSALAVGGAKGNAVAGEKKTKVCSTCHLENGAKSVDANTPLLAGQYVDYLEHTLAGYRSGERKHVIMNAQVANLSDADIEDLAAFYGKQQPVTHTLPKR